MECTHYWIIHPVTQLGVCKLCGAEHQFPSYVDAELQIQKRSRSGRGIPLTVRPKEETAGDFFTKWNTVNL